MDSRPALVPAGAAPEAAPRVAAPIVPDLLFPTPALRVDGEQLREGLVFAFASGVSGGLFAEALERARTGLSTWDARAFAADLFLDDFVTRCFRVRIGGRDAVVCRSHMLRLLAHPPADPEVVDFRRGVLGELAGSPDMRRELEDLYTGMLRLRSMIEGAAAGRKWDSNRRQLDVLTAAKHIFDHMAASFGSATSGLARLRQFGTEVQATEAYRSMRELLDYDEKLATLHLKIRVGADGRVRGFEILRVEENTENAFVAPALRRWLAKIELVARGYGFGDGEVMARLLDVVFEGLQDELVKLVQLMGDLELYLGVLGFRDMAREAGLEVCLPELVESADQGRSFEGLFNPLLVAHGVKAVPCDVATDRLDTTLLITGPNSGGKTRLLQSIALAQLLAQGGLFVPARSARLLAVPGLVVSLSQETRPDQSEGRLGMELMRIRALFEQLPPGAMVVLDELCSGTNPSEGEEIFELVMSVLSELRPQAFVTTHFLTFAARLEAERKIESLRFVQVELDSEQRPTYQFVAGVATTSLAYRAASRLGVTHDQLLALVTRNKQRAREAADSE